MDFKLTSYYNPTGDQPAAIAALSEGIIQNLPSQTLLGVTGSGNHFVIRQGSEFSLTLPFLRADGGNEFSNTL